MMRPTVHIDNLACFVRPGEVCLTWCDDPADPQYAISGDALARLLAARDARDRPLKVHKLPAPGLLRMSAREAAGIRHKRGSHARVAGWRLAGSYVNFYLANGGLVMPLLDPDTDRAAARVLKRLFPDRKVVGVPGPARFCSVAAISTASRNRCRSAPRQKCANPPLHSYPVTRGPLRVGTVLP